MVELLLGSDRDIDPEKRANDGQTPVTAAKKPELAALLTSYLENPVAVRTHLKGSSILL